MRAYIRKICIQTFKIVLERYGGLLLHNAVINVALLVLVMNNNMINKRFELCDDCIVLASNDAFAPCMAIMIQSIIDNAKEDKYYDIIILHKDISGDNQEAIVQLSDADNISIRFFDMNDFLKGTKFFTENRKTISEETYFRLFIPWIIDDNYKKALYIDGDMIVRNDISAVIDVNIEGVLAAGVRDYWGICNCYMKEDSKREYRESIGLTNIDEYIIGALILFNLKEFRERYYLDYVLKLSQEREWQQHDQDVINIMIKGSVKHISPTYAFMSDYGNNHYLPDYLLRELEGIEDNPVIYHFAASRKPWKKKYGLFNNEFWSIAKKTVFFEELLSEVKSTEYKWYILRELGINTYDTVREGENLQRFYGKVNLGALNASNNYLYNVDIYNGKLFLSGMVNYYDVNDSFDKLSISINEVEYPVDSFRITKKYKEDTGIEQYTHIDFTFSISLDTFESIRLRINMYVGGEKYRITKYKTTEYCQLDSRIGGSYFQRDGWLIRIDRRNYSLTIVKSCVTKHIKYELRFLTQLYKRGNMSISLMAIRLAGPVIKHIIRKPIWLVSDRRQKADDNGEAFFKYLNKNEIRKTVNSYFIIDKNDELSDYDRVSKIGKVIKPNSKKHKLLLLLSDYSISSQTDKFTRNPFESKKYSDGLHDFIASTRFVFLQHGIIIEDLTGWLNIRRQNIFGFVTSTNAEYDLISKGEYGYREDNVWLTGMPRYDLLEDCSNDDNRIVIMPTWRRYLTKGQKTETGFWELVDDFSDSDYASFYRDLTNDERLQAALKQYGYSLAFKIHPSFEGSQGKFGFSGDNVNVLGAEESYREIYKGSKLIISDYSSSSYDFLYLRKPVIYCQFDKEIFYDGEHQCKRGEFDYEKEGLGECVSTRDELVNIIIEYMKNDCKPKAEYIDRINSFFCFSDNKSSERVYRKIIEKY